MKPLVIACIALVIFTLTGVLLNLDAIKPHKLVLHSTDHGGAFTSYEYGGTRVPQALTETSRSGKPAAESVTGKPSPSIEASEGNERMVVKVGIVTLAVHNITEALREVIAVASRFGGYVYESYTAESSAAVRLRVPSKYFEEALLAVEEVGKLESLSVSSEDVTEQVLDLRSRLNASRALEARLLKLLEKAGTVEEVLKIEEYLTRVRADIERMEAQLKSLMTRVEYAEIRVELVRRFRVLYLELKCEVPEVLEEFKILVREAGGLGNVVESWSTKDSAYLVLRVRTRDVSTVEELVEDLVVDRRLSVRESGVDESTVVIRLYKLRMVEARLDLLAALQAGVNAMLTIVVLMISGAIALTPILAVGGAGYLGYRAFKKRKREAA